MKWYQSWAFKGGVSVAVLGPVATAVTGFALQSFTGIDVVSAVGGWPFVGFILAGSGLGGGGLGAIGGYGAERCCGKANRAPDEENLLGEEYYQEEQIQTRGIGDAEYLRLKGKIESSLATSELEKAAKADGTNPLKPAQKELAEAIKKKMEALTTYMSGYVWEQRALDAHNALLKRVEQYKTQVEAINSHSPALIPLKKKHRTHSSSYDPMELHSPVDPTYIPLNING